MSSVTAHADAGLDKEKVEVDPRMATLIKTVVTTDLSEEDQRKVLSIAANAYQKLVLFPTKSSWRKDTNDDPAWSRKMLEREVERVVLKDLSLHIKRELDKELGTLWHVGYGRSFAACVGFEAGSFIHFTLEGADVVAFRHGH